MTDLDHASASADSSSSRKLRRITRACDYCHKRSIRCVFPGATDGSRCQNCIDFDQACRFDREVKRRGVKPRNQGVSPVASTPTNNVGFEDHMARNSSLVDSGQVTWSSLNPASATLVRDLIEVYFEMVYPLFPCFHRPSLRKCAVQGLYLSDRFTFASIMALCSLTAATLGDSSPPHPHWDMQQLRSVSPSTFYNAAIRACDDTDILKDFNFDLLRTFATLTLAAIQCGKTKEAQAQLGRYHNLVDSGDLHNERCWPTNIGIVQREEWRRLHWTMYAVEVWKSMSWNTQIRVRERQTNVAYTTEVDDDFFDDTGYDIKTSSAMNDKLLHRTLGNSQVQVRSACWLYGWNFTIELYRLLEHLSAQYGPQQSTQRPVLESVLENRSIEFVRQLRSGINHMYIGLPQHFRDTSLTHYNQDQRRYGVQTVSIKLLTALLQLLLAKCSHSSVQELCDIASEVTHMFNHVAPSYGPMRLALPFGQLANVGQILSSILEEERSLSGEEVLALRVVLTSIVHILEESELGMMAMPSLVKLRTTISHLESATTSQIEQHHPPLLSPHPLGYSYSASQILPQTARPSEPQSRSQRLHNSTSLSHTNTDPLRSSMPVQFEQSLANAQFPLLSQAGTALPDPRADLQHWPQIWGYDYSRFNQGPQN